MSSTDPFDNDENKSFKGKPFDEACTLVDDDPDAKIFVHQKPSGSGRWDFCFSFLPGEYDELAVLEKIAEEFGGGEFPVQIKTKQDNGRPKILWQENMRVVARRSSVTRPAVAPAVVPPGAGLDVLAAALDNQTRLLTAVLEKVSQQPAAPVQQSREEFAKEMLAMKELFADNRPSGMESFKELLELQKIMVEASGGDVDPLTQAIKTLGPEIVEGVKEMREKEQRERAARTRPASAQRPRPEPINARPKFANIDVESAYSIFAENYLGNLLDATGHPAEDVANYVVRRVGDNDQLLHVVGLVVQEDNMVDRLVKFDARVMEHAHWLDDVADWLAHALWPDANDAPTHENVTFDTPSDEISGSRGINGAKGNGQDATDDEDLENPDDESGTGAPRGKLDNDS